MPEVIDIVRHQIVQRLAGTCYQPRKRICSLLDELQPSSEGPYRRLITHVKDRPGHDRRYAIDARKIERELGWRPAETFETGIRKTVRWYLDHTDWVANVQSGGYREWVAANYAQR